MKITASSDSIEDTMRLGPRPHLRGNSLLPLVKVLANPRSTKRVTILSTHQQLAPPALLWTQIALARQTAAIKLAFTEIGICQGNGGHGSGTRYDNCVQ
eukprot:1759445-Pyramimonas_sp.AAC.1